MCVEKKQNISSKHTMNKIKMGGAEGGATESLGLLVFTL